MGEYHKEGITRRDLMMFGAASRHKDRFFPIYRPEALQGDLGTGSRAPPTREELRQNTRQVAENIEGLFPGLGMVGMKDGTRHPNIF